MDVSHRRGSKKSTFAAAVIGHENTVPPPLNALPERKIATESTM
jgi:hypothetical protein